MLEFLSGLGWSLILVLGLVSDNATSLLVRAPPLFRSLSANGTARHIPDCQSEDIMTCRRAEPDFEALRTEPRLEFPMKFVLEKMGETTVDENTKSLSFEDDTGSSALLTLTLTDGGQECLTGTIRLSNGRLFSLSNCGLGCHVLIEEGRTKANGTTKVIKASPEVKAMIKEEGGIVRLKQLKTARQQKGKQAEDPKKMYNITVMLYYTEQFANTTSNIPASVSQLLSNANLGYINSDIAVRLKVHCLNPAPIAMDEDATPEHLLDRFMFHKGNYLSLFHSADLALLLVSKAIDSTCGIAYLDGFTGQSPAVGWVAKGCDSTTLGHEVGHMFGAAHNRRFTDYATQGGYEHGNCFRIRIASQAYGICSIMAYNSREYPYRINYYSSPDVKYRNYPTGDGDNNVKKAIVERRSWLSQLGDESDQSCDPQMMSNISIEELPPGGERGGGPAGTRADFLQVLLLLISSIFCKIFPA